MKKNLFLCLLALITFSACSSEQNVVDAMKVYEVTNGGCKKQVADTDSRADDSRTDMDEATTLSLILGDDGVVKGVLANVSATCIVQNFFVSLANNNNQLVLVAYHEKQNALTDCYCNYDISFKLTGLVAGSYPLKIYFANPDAKYTEQNLMFDGLITIKKGKSIQVTLKDGRGMPD